MGPPRKLNPTRPQFIWRVKTTAIDIPRQFRHYHVAGFDREPRLTWTRNRKVAEQIGNPDEQAGGQPRVSRHVARRCAYCGCWWLGFIARFLREFECRAWISGEPIPPCPGCRNARVWAAVSSSPDLLTRYLRDPESTAKAILDLPIELEFSGAASGPRA